jgi:hypothetical protein
LEGILRKLVSKFAYKLNVYRYTQGTFDYWADPMTIFWVNMVMMNFAEVKRGQDYWYPGSQVGLDTTFHDVIFHDVAGTVIALAFTVSAVTKRIQSMTERTQSMRASMVQ